MAGEQSTTERAIFTEALLRNLTWAGPRIVDGKVMKGTTGNMKPGAGGPD
jgi:hypothetical protein